LLALGCTIAWASLTHAGFALLILGLCVVGAGIGFPYASASWIALAGSHRPRPEKAPAC
jgi:hypothetical protein